MVNAREKEVVQIERRKDYSHYRHIVRRKMRSWGSELGLVKVHDEKEEWKENHKLLPWLEKVVKADAGGVKEGFEGSVMT